MLEEKDIAYIRDEIATIASLARILESNYENDSEVDAADLWALVVVIKENLNDLSKYMKNLNQQTKNTEAVKKQRSA